MQKSVLIKVVKPEKSDSKYKKMVYIRDMVANATKVLLDRNNGLIGPSHQAEVFYFSNTCAELINILKIVTSSIDKTKPITNQSYEDGTIAFIIKRIQFYEPMIDKAERFYIDVAPSSNKNPVIFDFLDEVYGHPYENEYASNVYDTGAETVHDMTVRYEVIINRKKIRHAEFYQRLRDTALMIEKECIRQKNMSGTK